MDLSKFYRDERKGQFTVEVRFEGTARLTVQAADAAEARAKAEKMVEAEDFEPYASDIEDASVRSVHAEWPMYLIHRPGTTISAVSHPKEGDEPRAPQGEWEQHYVLPGPAKATGEQSS